MGQDKNTKGRNLRKFERKGYALVDQAIKQGHFKETARKALWEGVRGNWEPFRELITKYKMKVTDKQQDITSRLASGRSLAIAADKKALEKLPDVMKPAKKKRRLDYGHLNLSDTHMIPTGMFDFSPAGSDYWKHQESRSHYR